MKILILDDEVDFRDTLVKIFKKYVCEISSGAGSADFLDSVATTPYDLIITDLNMPEVTGFQLIDTIREGVNAETPIIVISGILENEIERLVSSSGNVTCLSKPFDREHLLTLVNRLINLTPKN